MSSYLELLHKYNVPVPRYTSYPTVPQWKESIDVSAWKTSIAQCGNEAAGNSGISLYVHLPFCESLCTYCGCTKKITTNHSVENEYISAVIEEWSLYQSLFKSKPLIKELHLGGGTPTFFSAEHLAFLIDSLLKDCTVHEDAVFSIEGHPNNTTEAQLQTLYHRGFKRVSYGVQDNNREVQRIINRIQPYENVQRAVETARRIGYTSVNFDLIYGLPKQTLTFIRQTIQECIALKPDRVAFYSYAHVPWTSKGQRLFDENDLPSVEEKMQLYVEGRKLFLQHGYEDAGMDHFALPTDELIKAKHSGALHRNFMGYTIANTQTLIGLGMSSISDLGTAYAQNVKTLHEYYTLISEGKLPVVKGCFLSEEDKSFKQYILNISCKGTTGFNKIDEPVLKQYVFPELKKLEADGLINWDENKLQVTKTGRNFIRNICAAFDLYLQKKKTDISAKPMYSKAI
ncbi:MAG: oxygen-independent coproporphyrinogen III oxidase [Chitinophagaceae bacterium]|jgi:oxygen-independent coproporphyrinogen-3 oxidase|nr:oxygen-independent coproporphyrinogen III oxidase [Chitinophagaceae bacterium]